ncbi:caspase-7-like [Leucoraja erinacea]|uniref:caspase-7-like n=1 Tax=Leucoraja erinaceus TaxID=7782 RepID=UPI002456285F|nr:caspase-7-like [Leucoraja erinacea]
MMNQPAVAELLKPRALIVSVEKFRHPSFVNRSGAATDAKKLHGILYKLGFQVELSIDPDASEILQLYRTESQMRHGTCFLSVLSSHGEEGVLYGADSEAVRLRDIYSMFGAETCPSLEGKPKIFFIQACRGPEMDSGVTVDMVETDSCDPRTDSFSHYLALPLDMAIHFSSCPDYVSFLRPSGSAFLQSLCQVLKGEQRHWELLRIMTRVNGLVAQGFEARGHEYVGKKQMPCFISRLRHEVYPFSGKLS